MQQRQSSATMMMGMTPSTNRTETETKTEAVLAASMREYVAVQVPATGILQHQVHRARVTEARHQATYGRVT